ncbi:MAG: hypothetical protein IKB07_09910 [Lachnospiraceae bacterium]|nr:hypothetical protein [Lachnospiraceae bacterium]
MGQVKRKEREGMKKGTKKWMAVIFCLTLLFCMTACQKEDTSKTGADVPEVTTTTAPTGDEVATPEPTAEPTAEPTKEPTKAPEPTAVPEHVPAKLETNGVPQEYKKFNKEYAGRVVEIEYPTYSYADTKEPITKPAYVLLPPKYDETKQYNVLYLMHGVGGDPHEWKITSVFDGIRCAMDNLMYYGEAEQFIIVVPYGRSSANYADKSMANMGTFYSFGQELRNDLIPYIDANYATYAEFDENGYDLTAARDHRAMAGLSMGGMQTINIGIGECLDIISYFGAFSAAPTSNTAAVTAEKLAAFEGYDVNYFYNICGTSDGTALASASAAVNGLDELTDKITDGENFMWQTVPGGHDHNVWHLGLYNFAQLVFK